MRHLQLLAFVAVILVLLESSLFAQPPYDPALNQGIQPFQSYDGGDLDSVNLATGGLSLHIPVVSFPQRGAFHLDYYIGYSSPNAASDFTYEDYGYWIIYSYPPTISLNGFPRVYDSASSCGTDCTVSQISLVEGNTSHPLGYTNSAATQARSVDGTGFFVTTMPSQWGNPCTVIDSNGITTTWLGFQATATDSNGNQMTTPAGAGCTSSSQGPQQDYSTFAVTDTMGRKIPAVSFPWVIPGPNGGTQTYQSTNGGITLPDGTSYSFQYTSVALPQIFKGGGQAYLSVLSNVTLPSGGSISYGYALGAPGSFCNELGFAPVTSRTVNANDGTGPHTWMYSYAYTNSYSPSTTTVTDPLGNISIHTFENPCSPYETQLQEEDSGGHLLKTVQTTFEGIPSYTGSSAYVYMIPTSVTTTWPEGQQSAVSMTYDRDHGSSFTFGLDDFVGPGEPGVVFSSTPAGYTSNPWTKTETDYGNGGNGAPLRTTNTSYLAFSNSNYFNENLLDLASSVQVENGSGTQQAYTTYGYDESGLQSSGVTEQKIAGESYPGNLTSVHRWLSNGSAVSQTPCNVSVASGGYLVTNNIYFDTGELQKSTDPCLYPTSYLYSSTYYGAYPTTVTNALNQNTTYGYDFNTGHVTSMTDPNLQPTTETYDIMGRLTGIAYPDGGSTTYCYTDLGGTTCSPASAPPYEVVTTKAIKTNLNETSTTVYDGLDRVSQTQLNSDPSGTTYTQTVYDALGRKSQVYNPTRCSPPTTNCNTETTWGSTTYNYDALSRVTSVVEQDGSKVSTNYSAFPCTTVTDEVGNARESCVDGLGHLTSVLEDPGSSPHLNYKTVYAYSALDDLLSVTQNGSNSVNARTRNFAYDSLSRLTSATNPESGTITSGYDADGNVIAKTAPSPNQGPTGTKIVTTTNTYDTLNRLAGKSYNDGYASNGPTPPASYAYDGIALTGCTIAPPALTDSYPVGRRTSMCDGSGGTSWAHDTMGRILQERRTIGTIKGDYENDLFNLDGSVATMTSLNYGVGYTYGGDARPLTAAHGTSITFVSGATYAPPGELTGGTLGPFTVANAYNARLQPILLSAGIIGQNAVFSECFNFNLSVQITGPAPCSFSASTTGDNGNVYEIVNNRDNTRNQNFIYDSLNRIQQAYSSGTQWGETYGPTATSPGVAPTTSGIDAWGNLTNRSGVTGKTYSEGTLSVSAGTNNQLSGFGYDPAGNMTSNGSASYVYDDENRLIATAGDSYIYDGDSQRVKKCTEGSTPGSCATSATGTLYWRGSGSAPLTETDLLGNVQNTYIFFNGQRVGRSDSTGAIHYYFSDHLGSHGVVENATGSACEQDVDYYPYGGEENDYCATQVSQNYKFTGKERDNESGLDNFDARYNASSMGRFMTPDWSESPDAAPHGDLDNPQTVNLYTYVENGPSFASDPDGHEKCTNGVEASVCVYDTLDEVGTFAIRLLYRTAQQTSNVLSPVASQAKNFLSAPRNPGCMAAAMAKGSAIGSVGGGLIGSLGFAGGPTGFATVPAGMQTGLFGGAAVGWVAGMASCQTGGGGGSGGSGSGSGGGGSNASAARKLSNSEANSVAKRAGYPNAEALKKDFVGGSGGRYDLYKQPNGDIEIFAKGGLGEGIQTGINVKN
jgi:RHS repeat-associated protein